jgi:hypothetical protein
MMIINLAIPCLRAGMPHYGMQVCDKKNQVINA